MTIEDIIRDYLDGRQLTEDETDMLIRWREDDANERLFLKLRSLKDDTRLMHRLEQDREKTFARIVRRLDRVRTPQRMWARISVAAAVVLVVAGVGWAILKTAPEHSVVAQEEAKPFTGNILPGTSKAILELADGRMIDIDGASGEVIESDGSVITLNDGEVSYAAEVEAAAPVYNQITIPRSGEYKVTLGDGTQVWINSESSLRYPQTFSDTERRVYLKGEAYFSVTKNEGIPFIVETDEQTVTVLGTEFNISAYPDERKVLTTLLSGSVSVAAGGNDCEKILVPGQQLHLDNTTRQFSVKKIDMAEVSAWREGYFVIEDQTLEEVVRKLSRWYDVDFVFESEKAREMVFKGSIPKYENLDEVLNVIQTVSPVKFTFNGNDIMIKIE